MWGEKITKKMCVVRVGILRVSKILGSLYEFNYNLVFICVLLFTYEDLVIIKLIHGAQNQFPSGNWQNVISNFPLACKFQISYCIFREK